jgi:ribosomal peptide maturation radical SAM protein 1
MTRTPSVTLISMPWTTLVEPSLGLGILRSVLDRAGIASRVRHLNLEMLRWLTAPTYLAAASVFALNDFLFSGTLDAEVTPYQERLLREKAFEMLARGLDEREYGGIDAFIEKLLGLRAMIPSWLDEVADEIAASDVTLIGFTCMFDQTIASVALARRIADRAPDRLLALGGYAVRSPAGDTILRAFPWIDAVCTGDGEQTIVELARASASLQTLESVSGILVRHEGGVHATLPPAAVDMDDVPVPNYDDFFADVARMSETHQVDIEVSRLPIENSRGCWWGAVHHCVFCGIHDDDMRFRARSPERVLETMDTLSAKYGVTHFRFADYILPHGYHQTLVPELVRRNAPYRITCEVKANFTAGRFAQLAAGGFANVQPGVESFSTAVLQRMDKGVTASQNVHTLLLGRRHGVHIDYNLLYGLPGDAEEEYEEMLRQLPRLAHLDPPDTRLEVQITRYAPLQVSPERFGIAASPHAAAYDLVFSRGYLTRTGFDLDAYCYYFERPFENPPRLERLFRRIDRLVDDWRAERDRRQAALWYRESPAGVQILDSRILPERTYELDGSAAVALLAASEPTLARRFDADVLARLDELGLIFRDGDRIISLALPMPELAEGRAGERAA